MLTSVTVKFFFSCISQFTSLHRSEQIFSPLLYSSHCGGLQTEHCSVGLNAPSLCCRGYKACVPGSCSLSESWSWNVSLPDSHSNSTSLTAKQWNKTVNQKLKWLKVFQLIEAVPKTACWGYRASFLVTWHANDSLCGRDSSEPPRQHNAV